MNKTIEQIMKELAEPMPFKWRVQSFSKFKPQATCVAYVDSRDVQRRLDEVLGADNWQSDYKQVKNNMFAGIGVRFTYDDPGHEESKSEWVWKWDCGTESNTEKEKGEASDSFKRAAVKWGVGRFLYDLDMQYVPANEKKGAVNFPYPVDAQGKQIWNITEHINRMIAAKNKPQQQAAKAPAPKPQQAPVKPQAPTLPDNSKLIKDYNDLLAKLPEAQQKALQLTEEAKADAAKLQAGIKYLNNMIQTKENIKSQTVKA